MCESAARGRVGAGWGAWCWREGGGREVVVTHRVTLGDECVGWRSGEGTVMGYMYLQLSN